MDQVVLDPQLFKQLIGTVPKDACISTRIRERAGEIFWGPPEESRKLREFADRVVKIEQMHTLHCFVERLGYDMSGLSSSISTANPETAHNLARKALIEACMESEIASDEPSANILIDEFTKAVDTVLDIQMTESANPRPQLLKEFLGDIPEATYLSTRIRKAAQEVHEASPDESGRIEELERSVAVIEQTHALNRFVARLGYDMSDLSSSVVATSGATHNYCFAEIALRDACGKSGIAPGEKSAYRLIDNFTLAVDAALDRHLGRIDPPPL